MPRFTRREQRTAPEATQEGRGQGVPYAAPGAEPEEGVNPELAALLLTGAQDAPLVGAFRTGSEPERPRIGRNEIARATEILTEYKQGKTMLENRVIEDELWWELRHW